MLPLRVYKEDTTPVMIYSYGDDLEMQKICNKGLSKLKFKPEEEQTKVPFVEIDDNEEDDSSREEPQPDENGQMRLF